MHKGSKCQSQESLKNNPGICQALKSGYLIYNEQESICFILTTAIYVQ